MVAFFTVLVAAFVLAAGFDVGALAGPASASSALVASPVVAYASNVPSWPMFENNVYIDCTVASAGDLIEAWDVELGQSTSTLSDAQAVSLFHSMGGTNTRGVSIGSILGKWQTTGLFGSVIASAAPLNNTSVSTTELAIYLLGGVVAEAYLTPDTELELTNGQTVTSTAPGSASLAHALIFIGYNAQYLTAVTFGHVVEVSWAWWLKNGVAEYGVIPESFVSAGHGPITSLSTAYLSNWLRQSSN